MRARTWVRDELGSPRSLRQADAAIALHLAIPHARAPTAPSVRYRGHNHGERNDDPELAYASLSQLSRQVGADQLRLQRARS